MERLKGSVFAAVLMFGTQVQAQGQGQTPQPQQQQPRSERPTSVETITVTAEKTETNIQDTPLSIQAVSARDLDNLNITNTADLGTFVPGVNLLSANNTNAQLALFFRGTGNADNDTVVASATALYVDGVYIGTGNAAQFDLLDIERIEALKGPQGTLFGRNTVGGALSVVSKKPAPEWGGRLRAQFGEDGEQIYRGSINIPLLSETLFTRISLLSRDRNYFFEPKSGDGHDDDHQEAGRFALRWLPTERATIDYSTDRIKIDNHNPAWQLREVFPGSLASFAGPTFPTFVRSDNGAIATNEDQFTKFDIYQHAVTLTLDATENMELKSISGWRRYLMSGENDLDGSTLSVFNSGQHAKHRTYFQELQAVGSSESGFWDYVFGATWFEEETDSDNFSDILECCDLSIIGIPNGSVSNTGKVEQDAYAWGVYTQHTLHLTDQIDLTGGLRYSKERKEMTRSLCPNNPGLIRAPLCPAGNLALGGFVNDNRDTRFDNWSPLGRLSYRWTEDVMTWLSWSRGYRSGGFGNRPSASTDPVVLEQILGPFDEETVSQWETGIKSTLLDNRLQFNASAYYSQYEDQQLTLFIPAGGTATFVQNAGKSRIRGWETDIRAVPVDGLEIVFNHAYTNSDFSEFIASPGPGQPVSNLADQRKFPVIPKRTYAGIVTYTFPPMAFGTFEVSGNFRRFGKTSFHIDDNRRAVESSHYTVYGLRASLIDPCDMEGVTVSLLGSNVTDRSYRDNGINFGLPPFGLGYAGNTYGDPRHFAVEFTYDWGGER
jgi:iron complex outermembrane receptor protein